jgi:hypothetical protein
VEAFALPVIHLQNQDELLPPQSHFRQQAWKSTPDRVFDRILEVMPPEMHSLYPVNAAAMDRHRNEPRAVLANKDFSTFWCTFAGNMQRAEVVLVYTLVATRDASYDKSLGAELDGDGGTES